MKTCWSNNAAAGFIEAITNCAANLEEAAKHIRDGRWNIADKPLARANSEWESALKWMQLSNDLRSRNEVLVQEVLALRQGHAITYPQGQDPVNPDWKESQS